MFLILLGAPGTGKGTQANRLAQTTGWVHISTGEMLREAVTANTLLGQAAKKYMEQGALVPDELVIDMLIQRLERPDAEAGVILDGFPRNLHQARALEQALEKNDKSLDVAVHIAVPDDELVRRLGGRWICRKCGAIYNENSNAPQERGKCDRCGGELYQRDDDKAETVKSRLAKQKPPPDMLAHYRLRGKMREIDGMQPVDKVTDALMTELKIPR